MDIIIRRKKQLPWGRHAFRIKQVLISFIKVCNLLAKMMVYVHRGVLQGFTPYTMQMILETFSCQCWCLSFYPTEVEEAAMVFFSIHFETTIQYLLDVSYVLVYDAEINHWAQKRLDRAFCCLRIQMLKPSKAAKEIIWTWFFTKNSCTVIQSRDEHS